MVSVIIPVYNEPRGLQQTLASLVRQDFPSGAYEIIVVDNGSSDHTFEEAVKYYQQHPNLIKALKEDTIQGSYAARNKGLSVAKGDIICFIDADMTVEPDYLSQVVKVFQTGQPDYLGCKVVLYADKKTLAAKYNQLNGFNVEAYLRSDKFVPTCCLSVKKSAFDIVGGFDHRLESGGDFDFGQRVFRAGLKQQYADHILMKHPARWKYSSLVKKSKRVARGIAQLYRYFPAGYEEHYKRLFRKKKYLPRNPVRIYRNAKEKKVPLNYVEALILSLYHIPLTYYSSSEAKSAYAKLSRQEIAKDQVEIVMNKE